MLSTQELDALLNNVKADWIVRTISVNKTDKFSEAVTAFANDLPGHRKPGYLIVGAKDDGSLSGLTVTDQLLQNLAALRSDGNIQPLPALTVQKVSLPGGDVAVVEVQPSDLPPVRYQGRVWIRVGPRRGVATEQEERILSEKRLTHARTFDARPCLDSRLEDLVLDLFQITYLKEAVAAEVLAENHRSLPEQLASLRFLDFRSGCPTNAGVILFGKNPLQWLSGAYIQLAGFKGPTLSSDVLWERQIAGDLLTVLREISPMLELQLNSKPVADSLLHERSVVAYPQQALREFVINAVLHRSYESTGPVRVYWFSDRVEIQSPGGLYGEASPENFPNRNSYRNPVLAEALKTLGFVNRFGMGVVRAEAALERNGNPPAEFHFDPGYVQVTVRRSAP